MRTDADCVVRPTTASESRGERNRIAIVTGVSLAHNPRALKEAITLRRAGHHVIVLGSEAVPSRLAVDEALARRHDFTFLAVAALGNPGFLNWVRSVRWRCRNKLGRALYELVAIENRFQLGYFVPELLRQAMAISADYYIVHLEQALWVGWRLLKAGFRVGIDMEDWYSEDLLPQARSHRPLNLLRSLEAQLLRGAAHAVCPSEAMSAALAAEYKCRPPAVIYNSFEWAERRWLDGLLKDRKNRRMPSVHWCSQTLGPGRGLEDLFAALPYINHETEIHLRGNPVNGFESWLVSCVPDTWRKRIFVHSLVPSNELLSRIAEHDIGFAGEQKYCRNKDLTISNKILQYLLGGLAVVASDTAGQREVARQAPGGVLLYPCGDAIALAERLNELLGSAERLAGVKATAMRAAKETFCWEKCAPQLVQSVERALCSPSC